MVIYSDVMDITSIAQWLLLFGFVFLLLGAVIWLIERLGIPLGKFPGDIYYENEKYSICIPLISSLVLSIFLTLIINVLLWFFSK
jgi:hypothetical protein